MVKGIDIFKKHFADHTNKFVLIGGTACDVSMGKTGQIFRTTKDLDIGNYIFSECLIENDSCCINFC